MGGGEAGRQGLQRLHLVRDPHAGQETTLQALYTSVHHFGGIVVAPGFTDPVKFADGNPYGTSHVDGQGTKPVDETTRAAARHQAQRVVRIAAQLKAA